MGGFVSFAVQHPALAGFLSQHSFGLFPEQVEFVSGPELALLEQQPPDLRGLSGLTVGGQQPDAGLFFEEQPELTVAVERPESTDRRERAEDLEVRFLRVAGDLPLSEQQDSSPKASRALQMQPKASSLA